MATPIEQSVRFPVVAGKFYPDDPQTCRQEAGTYLKSAMVDSTAPWFGAVIPHAGWICSGAIAAEGIATLGVNQDVQVVVIFGAVHTPIHTQKGMLDNHALWQLPGGQSSIDGQLYRLLLSQPEFFAVDERFHRREHAIEVQIPFIQLTWPNAKIVPIEVSCEASASAIGRATAKAVQQSGLQAVFLASSDLTHYGPNYDFVPAGGGLKGLQWAMENDNRLLRLVTQMQSDQVVPEVRQNLNACGGGAIAAVIAACQVIGAGRSKLLRHTNSYQTLLSVAPQRPDNAVGYASVLFG